MTEHLCGNGRSIFSKRSITVLLFLMLFIFTGCKGDNSDPSTPDQTGGSQEKVSLKLSLSFPETTPAENYYNAVQPNTSRAVFNRTTSDTTNDSGIDFPTQGSRAIQFVRVTVTDIYDSGRELHTDFELRPDASDDGKWKGILADLPVGTPLSFEAKAYVTAPESGGEALFLGTTEVTLNNEENQVITIRMHHKDANKKITFPVISGIEYNPTIRKGSINRVRVYLKGKENAPFNFRFTAQGGAFVPEIGINPTNGDPATRYFSESGTYDFYVDFRAGEQAGEMQQYLEIIDENNMAVRQGFKITILEEVNATKVVTLFGSIITGIESEAFYGHETYDNAVRFEVHTDMDSDPSADLEYTWLFNNTTYRFLPEESSGRRVAWLTNYDKSLSGKISVKVTYQGISTTVSFDLKENAYPPGEEIIITPLIAKQVSANGNHTCVLFDNQKVKCSGANYLGQLGDSYKYDYRDFPNFVLNENKEPFKNVVKVVTGRDYSCAIREELEAGSDPSADSKVMRRAYCWGSNAYGKLGLGISQTDLAFKTIPGRVAIEENVLDIALGTESACALVGSDSIAGGVKCWGRNDKGQLGLGDSSSSQGNPGVASKATPTLITHNSLNTRVFQVKFGHKHACAMTAPALEGDTNNNVVCWGDNTYGQLGMVNTTSNKSEPVKISGLFGAIKLTAGSNHSCVLLRNGTVQCWGRNDLLQLGGDDQDMVTYVTSDNIPYVPVPATTLSAVNTSSTIEEPITSSADHTCALMEQTGQIRCWGNNMHLQSGTTAGAISYTDKNVIAMDGNTEKALYNNIQISAGSTHSCALNSGREVNCWGSNNAGQLGKTKNNLSQYADKMQELEKQNYDSVFPATRILNLAQEHVINMWFTKLSSVGSDIRQQWKLCYQRTRDGSKSSTFHNLCKEKTPTVVLMKLYDGTVIGGLTHNDWAADQNDPIYPDDGSYSQDSKMNTSDFIFALNHENQMVYTVYNSSSYKSTLSNYYRGPVFGYYGYQQSSPRKYIYKYDLSIDTSMSFGSIPNLGTVFRKSTTYSNAKAEAGDLLLKGDKTFRIKELEVYSIQ